ENNTFKYAPVEAFFGDFYYPGLLTDIFAGQRPKAPSDISQKDRRQPLLKLAVVNARPDTKLVERNLAVKIDLSELPADIEHQASSGARDVRLFRNGSLVKTWRGDVMNGKSSVTLEATLPIIAGENKLTAYAFNHDNIKSTDATLTVNGADSLKRQGSAYILAVGINKYSNQDYNLRYAVADARDFSAEVKRQQALLKRYAQIEVISLSDADATKTNILRKLTQLAARVQPEDTVIVYFAGHGTAQGKQFYLIPHDLGYDGPREKVNGAGLQTILVHSISDRELEPLFEGIDAGQLLLVIDACNSGQALETEEKRRGPMNSKGLAQLAYEKGMYVLTAAQSYQAAQEAARLGHGFLTYALVEDGLKRGAADREPKDRTISLREWLNYATEQVPRMQADTLAALRGRGRTINFRGDGSETGGVQRPRIFYRREVESNPLVIAILGAARH
ncbi:MAG: caspase family protein, partial [Acidobacteriota bacterium]